MLLAQIEKGIELGSQQLSTAAQFGPFVWMVGLIVILSAVKWAVVFVYKELPRSKHEIECEKLNSECLKSLTENLSQLKSLFAEMQGDVSGLFKYVASTSPDVMRNHLAEQQQLTRDDSWREERQARRPATGHA